MTTFLPQLSIPKVTAGAFTSARYKIKIDLFHDLNQELNKYIESLPPKLWKGFRLIAGDGTTVNLPVHKTTIEHFGLFRDTKLGGKTILANAGMLYDVLSNYVLASNISPFKIGEKKIISQLIEETDLVNSIIILDRSFCSFSSFKQLINKDLNFCVRLKTSDSLFAEKILTHPSNDIILDWFPSEGERSTCRKKSLDCSHIQVRATKVILPCGETEVLISSLLNTSIYSESDINTLYQMRWGIEEGYKKLKPKMKLEEFGCKRQEGIYQEFYSHIFMMNLTQIFCNLAQETIEIKIKKRKNKYKYNWTNAYKFIQLEFANLFIMNNILEIVNKIIQQIKTSIVAIIKGRSFKRTTQSMKKHRFSPMYK